MEPNVRWGVPLDTGLSHLLHEFPELGEGNFAPEEIEMSVRLGTRMRQR